MLNKKVALLAVFAGLTASEIYAGTLTSYAVGDVLVCFRKTSSSGNDLVVDAGQISTYTNTTVNQRIPISGYTGNQLALVGTNSIDFSAFTWFDDSVSQVNAQWTLFATRARVTPYVQSTAYTSSGAGVQQFTISDMQPVPLGAHDAASYNGLNNSTAVIEPDDTVNNPDYALYTSGQSYDYAVNGNSGNADFDGSFTGGNIEKATASGFILGGAVVRSDFYWIPPSSTVKYLGFFELNTNGQMTFVAKPTLPTVTTVAASAVGTTNATLNATVNPNSDSTSLFFQYGLNTSYGSNSVVSAIGTTSGSYGLSVSNLTSGVIYHYRVAAYNSIGTNYGSDLTFTNLSSGGTVTTPVITKIGVTNNIAYISFTTGNSGTYTLRGTNGIGLSASPGAWPPISSTGGNGFTNTLQDSAVSTNKFYIISAQ